eukprot:397314-Pyramimonas_sp.AAC.1
MSRMPGPGKRGGDRSVLRGQFDIRRPAGKNLSGGDPGVEPRVFGYFGGWSDADGGTVPGFV